ncbi:ATP-dependent DNA helicase RecG [Pontibacter sp. G13]|uniref:ATP-dependent DNA helicase RecG n=1 Tax=Pontibacter sp. G13 TaxID=3074898 RepID=UPI002889CA00|nr:ATP-dependent DNA helicase RecG [Pontibacter sp. G13]WNJ20712.1 ATP-dependent DNA helicase RecG [Pontibacter sp. G13]
MHQIWQKDITYLKRVGPQRAQLLKQEANIRTYGDLLVYFPRKYVDRSNVTKIRDIGGGDPHVTLVGKISGVSKNSSKRGRSVLQATFSDGSGTLGLTWFQGVRYVESSLPVGVEVALFGKVNRFNGKVQIVHPEIDRISPESGTKHVLKIIPFYPSSDKLTRIGLDARGFRSVMFGMLEEAHAHIEENLPEELLQTYRLMGRHDALTNIHFPQSFEHLKQARRRLKFEELFFFQLLMAHKRSNFRTEHAANPFPTIGPHFNDFYDQHMPFELTGAQKRVLKEIRADLKRPVQMNRLVQGDVGSGKTMVAFMTSLMAKDNGFQTALMAPTAILADQHFQKLTKLAEKAGMKTALLVGGQKAKERKAHLAAIESGEVDIAIGTHALIEDSVKFQKLGLVVVDEQHKFGVVQRAKLWAKAQPFPHNLIMTATPIPRTLAMTLYGDVDVSVIDELPPGRKPIKTLVHHENKRLEVFGFIRRELEKGRQAYVVYPLVEESEKLDLIAAEKGHELLQRAFPNFRVGLVHGKMKAEDKDIEMEQFVKNQTQILVSTTVIEVGVDVPNSSIMLIEHAERFGLSQLHQLRGRVGRGSEQSYCVLMAGHKLSEDGKKRLAAMRDTTDGFKISEIDLELRGPGDFLGTRQSGLPEFQLANIIEDQAILKEARAAAFEIAETDPQMQAPEHQMMIQALRAYRARFGMIGSVA